ncbi:hypothetical protein BDZ90DRAFT_43974 [Jaminaea rosea]|uniref:Uncharacterized protein n=1 Tax=Jaminaea rosea TaxID=1569628 RepID=A0A316UPC1_9BASI|nr:hypothetical protein BDZ90DRAFT_43974 [Jaminaea rosea]PWN26618.1 hypothetical protein BDZ90DRAFT_43974 [Jaminaea rosea]
MRSMNPTFIALCAFLTAALASASTLPQVCNGAKDAHCLYTPIAAYRTQDPEIKATKGAIVSQERDPVGSITYLIKDGTAGQLTIFCHDGGGNKFLFDFGQGASSIVVDSVLNGNAKVYLNDNPGVYAGIGQTLILRSNSVGVDATVTCPH